jgi:citrate lyase beta subunit
MSLLEDAAPHLEALAAANRQLALTYPGDRPTRQPVHTVYGGAQLYKAETTRRLGELALRSLQTFAPTPAELAVGVGLPATITRDSALTELLYQRVQAKLEREAVEDFRIDFEDGFGARPDREEDEHAVRTATEVARGMRNGLLPPFIGIRIKSFSAEWARRGARTLELFLDRLLAVSGGALPDNFSITLPKVSIPEQPETLVRLLELLEHRHRLAPGSLRFEIMIETPQALVGPDGYCPLSALLRACHGRCAGAHLGTYDFTAACNITAAHQSMTHPLCELAKGMMLLAFAGTGIFLSDGATNVMPIPPHRGSELSAAQLAENRAVVHGAWQLSHSNIRHSLAGGFYQGWDLHPAQLPARYAACYGFFLEGLPNATERLKNFVTQAGEASLVGDVFDDAASAQGLLNYFLRASSCGAVEQRDLEETGLTLAEVQLRSFAKILAARRARLSS